MNTSNEVLTPQTTNKQYARKGRTYIPWSSKVTIANLRMASQDILTWKNAIDSARSVLNPRRKSLLDLYENIVIDGHLLSVMGKRQMAITNKKVMYAIHGSEGEVDEVLRDKVLETPWFYKMLTFTTQAKPWGHSLIELIPQQGIITDCELVPRMTVFPEYGTASHNYLEPENGIYFNDDPYWSKYMIPVGGAKDYGLLMTAAQYVIYKRGGFGDWAQFAELFGMPFRVGKYNPYDDTTRSTLDKALKEMGGAAHVTIPDGTAIEFHDNNNAGKSEVFHDLIDMCNKEISKIFLGQTMTTEDGSSKSQSEVHQDVEDMINLSDMTEIEYMLNWVFRKKILDLGFPLKDGKFFFENTAKIPLEKRIEMDVKLSEKVAIDEEYWYKTYGIPKPDGNAKPIDASPTKPKSTKDEPIKKEAVKAYDKRTEALMAMTEVHKEINAVYTHAH